MLVQMLTERVANGGSYNLTFGESLTMAGIGMLVVFMERLPCVPSLPATMF